MSGLFADRMLRRRIIFLVLTDFLWGLGCYFVLTTTTLPAYLRALDAPKLLIGAMVTAMGALPLLLQLFGRAAIERFPHRKAGVIILHLAFIAPYFLIAFADVHLAEDRPRALALLIIVALACSQMLLGLVIPVWLDMVARVIPLGIRGRFFGLTSAAFGAGGILGGLGLTGLQRWLGAGVFRGAFTLAGICYLLAMAAFALAPIPESAFDHPPEPSVWTHMRRALRACDPRTDFGRLVISFGAQALAVSIVPFLVLYASDPRGLGFPKAIFGQLTLWQALGGTLGAIALGWAVDRRGPRRPWAAMTAVVPAIMLLYPHAGWLPILVFCSLLAGVLLTHWSVGGPAMLELSPRGDKSGYVAIANLAAFVPSAIGPLLIARCIDGYGYGAAFLLAALAGVVALLAALTIRGRGARLADASEPPAS